MCVLHPKGSLTQYRHSTGGPSTAPVHWPKSLYTHTTSPSNIPVSTRPLRITALTEGESMYEDDRTGGRRGGGVSTWPVSRGIKQSVYRSQSLSSAMLA